MFVKVEPIKNNNLKKQLIFVRVFFLIICLIKFGSAQVPKDYKGKPFKDKYYKLGAQAIPGRVELAYYDLGGEGIAYHDNTPENTGNWHYWTQATVGEIVFPVAGLNLITLKYNTGANLAYFDFVRIEEKK